ncbi:DUF3307 domain-containing protein [Patescibacteria group bacterium]|nr:DUF3307 domain-containing protein [Patescibacteria group bacterium]
MEIFWLLAGHFLGDFAFQVEWIKSEKGKSWEINGYHAIVYTATVFVVAGIGDIALSPLVLAILFTSHFLIDPFKARWGIIKHIWIDQILHIAVLAAIAIFLL